MTLKEFILSRLQLFFFLVTLILFASFILGSVFTPDMELHYYHLLSPIILAAACVLPTCVTFYRKTPSLLQYIIRLLLELSMIEAIVMLLITPPENSDRLTFYITLGISVFIIYVLAEIMMWFQQYQQSKKLTSQLKKLHERENQC